MRDKETYTGQTIDVSSSGLRFMAAHPVRVGHGVVISIDWPVRLDGVIALQLMVNGSVVRSSGKETAVRLEGYAFKTRGLGESKANSISVL